MTDAARWKATVHVGGLSQLATSTHVFDAFIPFGDIVEVQLPKADAPNSTDPHKGFAYVEFEDSADAKEAIDNMDQSEFFGKVIKVSAARAPKSANEGLGSRKAIWEQVQLLSFSIFFLLFFLSLHVLAFLRFDIFRMMLMRDVHRRAGLLSTRQRMTSRIRQTWRSQPRILCKVSRGWMSQGQNRSDHLRGYEWMLTGKRAIRVLSFT